MTYRRRCGGSCASDRSQPCVFLDWPPRRSAEISSRWTTNLCLLFGCLSETGSSGSGDSNISFGFEIAHAQPAAASIASRKEAPTGVALTFECELGYTFDPAFRGTGFRDRSDGLRAGLRARRAADEIGAPGTDTRSAPGSPAVSARARRTSCASTLSHASR